LSERCSLAGVACRAALPVHTDTLLVINKTPSDVFTGQVAVAGFSPAPGATIFS
jgi:hypothetical protein